MDTTANPDPTDNAEGAADQGDLDATREQMRQALEKKHERERSGSAHLEGHAKASGPHGKAGGARQFRRKSGG